MGMERSQALACRLPVVSRPSGGWTRWKSCPQTGMPAPQGGGATTKRSKRRRPKAYSIQTVKETCKPGLSGDCAVDAQICPFDEAFDFADVILGNDQQVAGAQVRQRFGGGRTHGGLEVQDFGLRHIRPDPAVEDHLRMFGAGGFEAASPRNGLKGCH